MSDHTLHTRECDRCAIEVPAFRKRYRCTDCKRLCCSRCTSPGFTRSGHGARGAKYFCKDCESRRVVAYTTPYVMQVFSTLNETRDRKRAAATARYLRERDLADVQVYAMDDFTLNPENEGAVRYILHVAPWRYLDFYPEYTRPATPAGTTRTEI